MGRDKGLRSIVAGYDSYCDSFDALYTPHTPHPTVSAFQGCRGRMEREWSRMYGIYVMYAYGVCVLYQVWYGVSSEDGARMERLCASLYPELAMACPQFLRHKGNMIHPSYLIRARIPCTRAVHRAGEFIISFPYAYHAGFNCGLNCAEAVNFATPVWIPLGLKAKLCQYITPLHLLY